MSLHFYFDRHFDKSIEKRKIKKMKKEAPTTNNSYVVGVCSTHTYYTNVRMYTAPSVLNDHTIQNKTKTQNKKYIGEEDELRVRSDNIEQQSSWVAIQFSFYSIYFLQFIALTEKN